jgi:hypothetical protein
MLEKLVLIRIRDRNYLTGSSNDDNFVISVLAAITEFHSLNSLCTLFQYRSLAKFNFSDSIIKHNTQSGLVKTPLRRNVYKLQD